MELLIVCGPADHVTSVMPSDVDLTVFCSSVKSRIMTSAQLVLTVTSTDHTPIQGRASDAFNWPQLAYLFGLK